MIKIDFSLLWATDDQLWQYKAQELTLHKAGGIYGTQTWHILAQLTVATPTGCSM